MVAFKKGSLFPGGFPFLTITPESEKRFLAPSRPASEAVLRWISGLVDLPGLWLGPTVERSE